MNATYLVLYDGVCGLCNRLIRLLLRIDKNELLSFAPLQGTTVKELSQQYNFTIDLPRHPDTIIMMSKDRSGDPVFYYRSDAILEICRRLPYRWRWLYLLKLIPRRFRDWVYDGIAARRYRWFGKYDTCPLPSPQHRHRFLP